MKHTQMSISTTDNTRKSILKNRTYKKNAVIMVILFCVFSVFFSNFLILKGTEKHGTKITGEAHITKISLMGLIVEYKIFYKLGDIGNFHTVYFLTFYGEKPQEGEKVNIQHLKFPNSGLLVDYKNAQYFTSVFGFTSMLFLVFILGIVTIVWFIIDIQKNRICSKEE